MSTQSCLNLSRLILVQCISNQGEGPFQNCSCPLPLENAIELDYQKNAMERKTYKMKAPIFFITEFNGHQLALSNCCKGY